MPRGHGNVEVPEINVARGWCHPAQSKRTKCACGAVVQLTFAQIFCEQCRRIHRRDSRYSAFAATGPQPVRPGGKNGCPGVGYEPLTKQGGER